MMGLIYKELRRKVALCIHRPLVPIGAVLMLHRIDEPDVNGIKYNQHLKMSSRAVEEMVQYARNMNFRFVSLDELAETLYEKKKARRLLTITLDDGYRDNYLNGADTFRRMGVPYTIFVCTKMVNGEMLYWWEILEQIVLEKDTVILSDGRCFDCSNKDAKEQAFHDIRDVILKLPQNDLKRSLNILFSNYNIDWNYGNSTLALTWEHIKDLKKNHPLATIANHTYSHSAFVGLSDNQIKEDIYKAEMEMKEKAGIEMHHFAFPYGEATAVSQHDINLVKELGFKTSATTKDGLICYGTDPLSLPRIFMTEGNWKQVIDRIAENS